MRDNNLIIISVNSPLICASVIMCGKTGYLNLGHSCLKFADLVWQSIRVPTVRKQLIFGYIA